MKTQESAGPKSLSIAVMAYNEAQSIEPVVNEIEEVLSRSGRDYEIVIIDDGSTDGTGPKAEGIARAHPKVRVIHHQGNQGIGEVKRTGYREAKMDLVSFFPADGEFPASIIEQLLPLMEQHDLALGYLPERVDSKLAILLARCERLLIRLLFGKLPEFCGIYMVRRDLLQAMPLSTEGRGWMIQMELIIRAQRAGWRIVSVPTPVRQRMAGTSKVQNLSSVIENLRQLFLLFFSLRRAA